VNYPQAYPQVRKFKYLLETQHMGFERITNLNILGVRFIAKMSRLPLVPHQVLPRWLKNRRYPQDAANISDTLNHVKPICTAHRNNFEMWVIGFSLTIQ
jgi:hypothetical protein